MSDSVAEREASAGPGEVLREWRARRRRSQLELAISAGVSARHLSFVETGRSRASRELLLTLSESLEVPLRERNALLLAGGYAPVYTASDLDDEQLQAIRAALDHLLTGHEPYPALVIDRWGDMQLSNRAVAPLLAGVDPELLAPPVNIFRLSLHPAGLAPRIRNLGAWAAHLIERLDRLTRATGDARLAGLLSEMRGYGPPTGDMNSRPEHDVLLPLQLEHPSGELNLHSTVTHFGAPHDVNLAELAVESFFPADEATRRILGELAAGTTA
ncbi:helix-turn-helix domain-containing protein [Saccharopolyspora sp.]|uniref:MmyB family transcriptional regulator n=1 Tax=Saccharopolyspora sp. TaxID=33915 RepID=UPI0025D280E1|nr:helix-turn-helix domain-containing protein [Saccharopolyspora sp.]